MNKVKLPERRTEYAIMGGKRLYIGTVKCYKLFLEDEDGNITEYNGRYNGPFEDYDDAKCRAREIYKGITNL